MSDDMTQGWHVRGSGWQAGPVSWEELVGFVQSGRLTRNDFVWHASLNEWQPGGAIPGLFSAAPAAMQPAASAPAATVAPASAPAQAPRKRRGGMVALVAVIVTLLLVGGGFAGWWFLLRDGAQLSLGGKAGPSMGVAEATLPDPAKLIVTQQWGEVPSNQLMVAMAQEASRAQAEAVANNIGGTIVGEVEFINLYQLEIPSSTEAELVAAIEAAEAMEGVEAAYPVDQIQLDAEIWGVRIDPYNDPMYGGDAGAGYRAVGVSKAWSYIKGAGVDLADVKVGICDSGLYVNGEGAESEFGGDVKIEHPDAGAGKVNNPQVYGDGTTNAAGTHATGVATIIGGDPNNGGPSGVAGPLGKKLTMSTINIFGGNYGDTQTNSDPDDITKQDWSPGHSYQIGSLVALTKQVEAGAKVINCSWGNSNADPKDVATFTRFFTEMSKKHPDVLFVCSGGNGGKEMDGATRYPSGLKLPNMITVGALNNDGTRAEYGDWASDDYEITLSAPGTGAVVGMDYQNGGPVRQDGSSFAAPQVTAAAAILKSLNPKLTAGEIKAILVETARPGVPTDSTAPNATSMLVPSEMGGKILAVDAAVLQVINDLRESKGLDPLDEKTLELLGVVDAVAVTGEDGQYTVKGIVGAVGQKGATLEIEVVAENSAIGGDTKQSLDAPGEVEWDVTLPEGKGTIKVTRSDSGAASLITIEQYDISGHWDGSFTFTDVTITDEKLAEEQGCTLYAFQALKGKALPMTHDLTVDAAGQGGGTMFIDVGAADPEGETSSSPVDVQVSYTGSTVTFGMAEGEGVQSMTATVSRSGDTLTMNGTLTGGGPGFTMTAVFTVTKPYVE
jgi:hypothetical protein